MKRPLVCLLLIMSAILAGCYTQKEAARQVMKANANYPEMVAGYCGDWYPVKESIYDSVIYKKGKPVTSPADVVYINCDTIRDSVAVKCPDCVCPGKDTVYRFRREVKENKALLVAEQEKSKRENAAARAAIDRLVSEKAAIEISAAKREQKIKDLQAEKRLLRLWLWAIAGYFAASRVIKWKLPIVGKFLP